MHEAASGATRARKRSSSERVLRSRWIRRHDVHVRALEDNRAFSLGHDRVVLAHVRELARLPAGATLANDDRASLGHLTAVELDTAELRVGIATVLG